MNTLQTFDFNEAPVRVLLRDDQPWFVAADVCRVLELTNTSKACDTLEDDEKGLTNGDTPGGSQQLLVISESGLYALIFKSRKPEAKKFRKWVTADVLPAIRRSGGYSLPVDGIEQLSLLRFVREMCADWSLERQMDFGQTARRFAKSMGLCFQTGEEPGYGRVFIFPREMLCELRLQVARVNALPNGEAAEYF